MIALITGGVGFIGSNLADRLLSMGSQVIIFDNFSRTGVEKNAKWLKQKYKKDLKIIKSDVRDVKSVGNWSKGVDVVFHLAAQVAVTTSIVNPIEDFEVNALGTLNILEAARIQKKPPIIVYSSTNKVYGALESVKIGEGIRENQPLDFHSPYGCSKGSADQYVCDYARTYGLSTIIFRQSCVYGERQMGMEDQGWLAHFIIKALKGEPVNIFGDGKQIRDLLYVGDLIDAYLLSVNNIVKTKGEVFNIGGGVKNAVSILDAINLIERRLDKKIKLNFGPSRPGDQKIFISNNTKLKNILGFKVKTGYIQGLETLIQWLQNQNL